VREPTTHWGKWICAAVLVVALTLSAAAAAQASVVAKAPGQVRDYWTAKRMAAAVPAFVPSVSVDQADIDLDGIAGADRVGSRRLIAQARPASAAGKRGTLHRRVHHTRRFPNRTHGKVFFRSGGLDYVCSGTAVKSPSRSLVWTAGHCVYDPELLGGGFVTNFEFVPAYRKGHKPFGEWPAHRLQSTSQWKNSGGLFSDDGTPFDEGAAIVGTRNGKHLQSVVGARGIAFNTKRDHTYRAIGYPAQAPPAEFDGRHMFGCISGYGGADHSFGNPPPMRITCDMTGGSSGGGWVVHNRYIASVVSYSYQGDSNHLYGPYFGNVAQGLYRSVKDG
jgi:V8-like Glu-specific endopeptidase